MCITTRGRVLETDGKKALVDVNGKLSEVRAMVDVNEGDYVYCASGMAVEKAPGVEIEENSRNLFMRYSLPCAGTLVSRGTVKQADVDILIDITKNNHEIPDGAERIFKVAFAECSKIVAEEKKFVIDKGVIREYFLLRHDGVIENRYEEMKDFDKDSCRTRIGKVRSVENGFAFLASSALKKYRTDFVPDIQANDTVVTHWDFVVEKLNRKAVDSIQNARSEVV